MTDEIKEAAKAYVARWCPGDIGLATDHQLIFNAYVDGARSRDAEVEKLKASDLHQWRQITKLKAEFMAEQDRATTAEARAERYRKALNQIAAWDEGDVVNGSFDCPGHASFAREALQDEDGEK